MKRDLHFILSQITPLLDEWRLQTLARQHGVRKNKDGEDLDKLFLAFVRRADEGKLSRLLIEAIVLLASSRSNPAVVLRDAAALYNVNTDAIALQVKQEFAAKEKKHSRPTAPAKKAA